MLQNKILETKMHGIERYMESFKESISKRFEKQEEEIKSLADKMKSFEETQREYKKCHLNRRNPDDNDVLDLQHVKSFFVLFFNFLNCINFKTIYILGKI